MARLTPRILEFVAIYCADPHRNAADSYRRAFNSKGAPNTVATEAWKLLQRPEVSHIVARYDERIKENLILSASEIARIWSENITTDRNDLVELRRVPCRCCWSPNGEPQYTPAEMSVARKDHQRKLDLMLARLPDEASPKQIGAIKAAMEFDEGGGIGYDMRRDINDGCVECGGLGVERVIVKDTRKLSPAARAVYEGLKVTKDGIEIKMASREGATALLAKAYGMGADSPPKRGGDDARNVTPTDPIEASKFYARLMDETDD